MHCFGAIFREIVICFRGGIRCSAERSADGKHIAGAGESNALLDFPAGLPYSTPQGKLSLFSGGECKGALYILYIVNVYSVYIRVIHSVGMPEVR